MNLKTKLKNIIYIVLVITSTILLSLYLRNYISNKANDNINANTTDTNNVQSLNLEEAYVTKVVDGDTIWVEIGNENKKVRFIGLDCPEYTKEIEPYGKEATQYTCENLLNTTVYLQKDVTDTDKYDRLLRYVWTKKVDSITEENIENYLFYYRLCYDGMAESKTYKPNVLLQEYLNSAQKIAKEQNKGMWSN